jgi:hypothetical protein
VRDFWPAHAPTAIKEKITNREIRHGIYISIYTMWLVPLPLNLRGVGAPFGTVQTEVSIQNLVEFVVLAFVSVEMIN